MAVVVSKDSDASAQASLPSPAVPTNFQSAVAALLAKGSSIYAQNYLTGLAQADPGFAAYLLKEMESLQATSQTRRSYAKVLELCGVEIIVESDPVRIERELMRVESGDVQHLRFRFEEFKESKYLRNRLDQLKREPEYVAVEAVQVLLDFCSTAAPMELQTESPLLVREPSAGHSEKQILQAIASGEGTRLPTEVSARYWNDPKKAELPFHVFLESEPSEGRDRLIGLIDGAELNGPSTLGHLARLIRRLDQEMAEVGVQGLVESKGFSHAAVCSWALNRIIQNPTETGAAGLVRELSDLSVDDLNGWGVSIGIPRILELFGARPSDPARPVCERLLRSWAGKYTIAGTALARQFAQIVDRAVAGADVTREDRRRIRAVLEICVSTDWGLRNLPVGVGTLEKLESCNGRFGETTGGLVPVLLRIAREGNVRVRSPMNGLQHSETAVRILGASAAERRSLIEELRFSPDPDDELVFRCEQLLRSIGRGEEPPVSIRSAPAGRYLAERCLQELFATDRRFVGRFKPLVEGLAGGNYFVSDQVEDAFLRAQGQGEGGIVQLVGQIVAQNSVGHHGIDFLLNVALAEATQDSVSSILFECLREMASASVSDRASVLLELAYSEDSLRKSFASRVLAALDGESKREILVELNRMAISAGDELDSLLASCADIGVELVSHTSSVRVRAFCSRWVQGNIADLSDKALIGALVDAATGEGRLDEVAAEARKRNSNPYVAKALYEMSLGRSGGQLVLTGGESLIGTRDLATLNSGLQLLVDATTPEKRELEFPFVPEATFPLMFVGIDEDLEGLNISRLEGALKDSIWKFRERAPSLALSSVRAMSHQFRQGVGLCELCSIVDRFSRSDQWQERLAAGVLNILVQNVRGNLDLRTYCEDLVARVPLVPLMIRGSRWSSEPHIKRELRKVVHGAGIKDSPLYLSDQELADWHAELLSAA